jgi:hypothetical protein
MYTFQELIKCSVSCLTDSRGSSGIFVDLHDRAMLLTSTSVAFCGDSSRSLLWSDQFLFNVPILAKGLDATIPVSRRPGRLPRVTILIRLRPQALTLIFDNAKHNQNSRTVPSCRGATVTVTGRLLRCLFSWWSRSR